MALVDWKIDHSARAVFGFPLITVCFDFTSGHNGDVGVAVGVSVHRQQIACLLKGVDSAEKFPGVEGCTKQ